MGLLREQEEVIVGVKEQGRSHYWELLRKRKKSLWELLREQEEVIVGVIKGT